MKKLHFALLLAMTCLCLPRLSYAEQAANKVTAAPLSQAQLAAVLGLSSPDLGVPEPQAMTGCSRGITKCGACTTNADCVTICGGCKGAVCFYNARGCGFNPPTACSCAP
jgi:hypothetical protein